MKFKAVDCHVKPGFCLRVWRWERVGIQASKDKCGKAVLFHAQIRIWKDFVHTFSHWPCCFCFGLNIFHQRNMRKPSCILPAEKGQWAWRDNQRTEQMQTPQPPERHVSVDVVDISEHDLSWQHGEGEGPWERPQIPGYTFLAAALITTEISSLCSH